MVFLIASLYIFDHIFTLLGNMLSYYLKWTAFTSACLDEEPGVPILPLIQVTLMFLFMIFGITYDVLLYKFLKKRKKSVEPGHVRLMSWKTSKDDYQLYVPVYASILSILSLAVILVYNLVLIITTPQEEIPNDLLKLLLLYCTVSVELPMILLLTIRCMNQDNFGFPKYFF